MPRSNHLFFVRLLFARGLRDAGLLAAMTLIDMFEWLDRHPVVRHRAR